MKGRKFLLASHLKKNPRFMKKFTVFCFALFLGFSAWSQIPSYLPQNGLVAWYPFNGNSDDSSGNSNHATNYGATLTTDRKGNANAAYSFSSSYLKVDVPSWTFAPTDSFSYSFWVKQSSNGAVLMSGSGTNGNFISLIQCGNTNFQFGVNKQGSPWTWASTTPTLNKWQHYVAVYEGGNMSLYLNGAFVSSNTFSLTTAAATNLPFYIGKDIGTFYFTGSIDDIAIYQRSLSATEIGNIYQDCNLGFVQNATSNITERMGRSVSIKVTANQSATYQWQVDSGTGFTNISNGGTYLGANTDSLIISNLTLAQNQNKYRCAINTTKCSDTSSVTTLTVLNTLGNKTISNNEWNIYPNPGKNILNIQTSQAYTNVTITDVLGRVMYTKNLGMGTHCIDTEQWNKGQYFIQLNRTTSRIWVKL